MNKLKRIWCVLFGHSNKVNLCFGYVYCNFCGEQIGDCLAGCYDLTNKIIVK